MKLKVKDLDIETGGVLIVVINREDARKLDLYNEDRVVVKKGKKSTTAMIDIAESSKAVAPGQIGMFEEILAKIDAKQGDTIDIDLGEKPEAVKYIRKKLDNNHLSRNEIDELVKEIVNDELSAVELTFFVSACYTHGMSLEETVSLTKSIVKYGSKLKLNKKIILDKHSSGGVPGNRTTMVIVPIVAAAGLTIPKTSSRSITSPAGTADTMEVLCPVSFSAKKMSEIVNKIGACIAWGGAVNLAAADDKLIKLRHPLSLDPEGMLLASILAKKSAVGATHVLIDIPVGKETKIKTIAEANHLKREFIKIGKKIGMHIHVMISDGDEPVGSGIGPALEARDVLWLLKRDARRPMDLERKSVYMATRLLHIAGLKNAKQMVLDILDSGAAYSKMRQIIEAQGGNPDIEPDNIHLGKYRYTFRAKKSGTIMDIDNITINKVARVAGAPEDKGAGVYLYKHERQIVKKGEPIFTIFAESEKKLEFALHILGKIGGIVIDGYSVKPKDEY